MKLVIALALLAGVSVFAQDAQEPAARNAPSATPDAPAEDADTPSQPDYAGPAILSRGGSPSIAGMGEHVRLRPFVTVNGIYDSGLQTTSIDSLGKVPFSDGYGVETTFGVNGTEAWKTSKLDLDYRGSFRHYTQNQFYDGMDNSLLLGYEKRLSPRVTLVLSDDATRYERAFSLPLAGYYNTGFDAYNPLFTGLTTNNLFDSPTTVLLSTGRLVYQRTARLSFSVGGNGFFVRYRSPALIGSNGYSAMGDIAYRLTRYQTISVEYDFNHFDFQNRYGQTDMHGANLNYSVRLGRYWEISLLGGGYHVETLRLVQVQLDPVIAAILGENFGVSKFHGTSYLPRLGAHLARKFRNGSASASYDRTVLAGNGVYTTSGYENGTLGYSYTGFRHWSLQTGATYSRFSSVSQLLGRYRNYSGGAGFNYKLTKGISMMGRFDARHYNVQASTLNRTFYRASFGLGWSPGDYPLSLW